MILKGNLSTFFIKEVLKRIEDIEILPNGLRKKYTLI